MRALLLALYLLMPIYNPPAPGGGGLTNIKVSADTLSALRSDITFSNSGGVSFGLNTNGVITATVATNYQSSGAYLTTAALSQDSSKYAGTNGAITGGSITVNTSGVSVNLPAYLTTAMQSNAATISNIKVSAGTLSQNRSDVTFSNLNGLSFGLETNGVITGSYTVPTVTNSSWTVQGASLAAGATTSGTVALLSLSNANGVSLFLSTGAGGSHTIVGSVAAQTVGAQSFGMNTSTAGGATGGTSGYASGGQVRYDVYAGSNITLSQSVNGASGSMSIYGPTPGAGTPASYWDNGFNHQGSTTMGFSGSTSHIQPFFLPYDISISYLRFLVSASFNSTATIATTNAATGSMSISSSLFAVIYTQKPGASSQSLGSYFSSSVGFTQRLSLSANATAGSQWTLSKTYSFQNTTGATSFTTQSVASTSNINLASDDCTVMTGMKALEIPFATSLSQGNYWIMFGISSGSQTGGSGTLTRLAMSVSNLGFTRANLSMGHWGNNTNASDQYLRGLGSFSTNAINTTASLGFSNISSSGSHQFPWFQFHRIT